MTQAPSRPIHSTAEQALDPATPRRARIDYGVNAIALVLAVFVILVLLAIFRSPNMKWHLIEEYLFNHEVLRGVSVTLLVTFVSMFIAVAVGLLVAIMRTHRNPVLVSLSWLYVWFFRSVPALVLLLIVYNLALLLPTLSFGVPFGGPKLLERQTRDVMNGLVAGIFVLGFQQAAYTSEAIRAALQAIPKGQHEAGMTLGMTATQRMRLIVIPQATRIALPTVANETIHLMKGTSLLAFIAVADLLYSTQLIYARTYQVIPLLMVACIWYVVLVSTFSVAQTLLERYLKNGSWLGKSPKRTVA